ncbi:helix-turn-helix domain-containing protein [Novosphingobium terrae]|uniref:helix-turn-helix domain-containing protein n=1 Tax=Novosphingobium terrae TaxID=2726189 RepID=UPI001981C8D6|nr:helix-turn-helix domain-containing protein [Novosphingobium terrae]
MNMRKLAEGFRLLLGAMPSAFVPSTRLDEAHRLIASGEWSVSQAAWEVGYTPAAFATAFRRRFGVAPSVPRG